MAQLPVVLSYRLSKKPVPVVKTVILAAHILSLYYRLHAIEENGWFSQIDHKTHFKKKELRNKESSNKRKAMIFSHKKDRIVSLNR